MTIDQDLFQQNNSTSSSSIHIPWYIHNICTADEFARFTSSSYLFYHGMRVVYTYIIEQFDYCYLGSRRTQTNRMRCIIRLTPGGSLGIASSETMLSLRPIMRPEAFRFKCMYISSSSASVATTFRRLCHSEFRCSTRI